MLLEEIFIIIEYENSPNAHDGMKAKQNEEYVYADNCGVHS